MSRFARKKFLLFVLAGSAGVVAAAVLSVLYGSTDIPVSKIWQALTAPDLTDQQQIITYELRIPRTLGCMLVGAAFAVAGAIMQGVTRNPLADSGLLGINSGATFALALCLALLPGINFSGTVLLSFLGALGAMVIVYGLMSLKRQKLDPVRLVLAGSAVSLFLSSLSQGISMFYNIGYDLTFWTAGGVSGIRGAQLVFAAPVILAGLVCAVILSRRISLLSGPISFVGLLVPHVVRFFVGADYRSIIPCSMIAGAFFMLIADIISRTINAPAETPIGLVFAVVGVPFFIWTARREERNVD